MDKFLEKVLDKSIFKEKFSVKVPADDTCPVCKGSREIRVAKEYRMVCPKCGGKGVFPSSTTRIVDNATVQYVPIAFEENKEKVLYVSVSYEEGGQIINTTVKPGDIAYED